MTYDYISAEQRLVFKNKFNWLENISLWLALSGLVYYVLKLSLQVLTD